MSPISFFEVNPRTGALQVVSVSEATEAVQPISNGKKRAGILAQFDDELLLSFGVPAVLLPSVRAVAKPDELLSLTKHLPAERKFLGQRIKELVGDRHPEEVCLVARTNKMLKEDYQPILSDLGIRCALLDKNREGQGVRLATMHRVKGLEFPVMILAGTNASILPLRVPAAESDAAAWAEHLDRERSLLFVAATRARDLLVVTSWGTASPFLQGQGGRA